MIQVYAHAAKTEDGKVPYLHMNDICRRCVKFLGLIDFVFIDSRVKVNAGM